MSKPGFAGSEVVLKSTEEVFTFLQWAEGAASAQWGPSIRAVLLARDGTVHMHDFSDVIFCMSESESEIRDVPDTAPSEEVIHDRDYDSDTTRIRDVGRHDDSSGDSGCTVATDQPGIVDTAPSEGDPQEETTDGADHSAMRASDSTRDAGEGRAEVTPSEGVVGIEDLLWEQHGNKVSFKANGFWSCRSENAAEVFATEHEASLREAVTRTEQRMQVKVDELERRLHCLRSVLTDAKPMDHFSTPIIAGEIVKELKALREGRGEMKRQIAELEKQLVELAGEYKARDSQAMSYLTSLEGQRQRIGALEDEIKGARSTILDLEDSERGHQKRIAELERENRQIIAMRDYAKSLAAEVIRKLQSHEDVDEWKKRLADAVEMQAKPKVTREMIEKWATDWDIPDWFRPVKDPCELLGIEEKEEEG